MIVLGQVKSYSEYWADYMNKLIFQTMLNIEFEKSNCLSTVPVFIVALYHHHHLVRQYQP